MVFSAWLLRRRSRECVREWKYCWGRIESGTVCGASSVERYVRSDKPSVNHADSDNTARQASHHWTTMNMSSKSLPYTTASSDVRAVSGASPSY